MDKTVLTLKATHHPDGDLSFDLGAIEALLVAEGGIQGLTNIQLTALATVQDGGLLKLDAVQGSTLKEVIGSDTFGCGHAIPDDKWFGVLPALQLATGPFERKSQAMNGVVLALLGLSPRMKRTDDETIEMHVHEPTETKETWQPLTSDELAVVQQIKSGKMTIEDFEGQSGAFSHLIRTIVGPEFAKGIDESMARIRRAVAN